MSNHDETFGDFDPAAAAEAFLAQPYGGGMEELPPEELARIAAEAAQQNKALQSLAEHGVDLDLGDDSLEAKVDKTMEEIEGLRDKWDTIAARQISGDTQEEDQKTYRELTAAMEKIQAYAELLDLARLVVSPLDGTDTIGIIQEDLSDLIATIATSPGATPKQKAAYLRVLEEIVSSEKFSAAKESLQATGQLEQRIGEMAIWEKDAAAKARELQSIQQLLIHELGVANISHDDWMPFSRQLLDAKHLQQSSQSNTFAHVVRQIRESSSRLGIGAQHLTHILEQIGITAE